MDRVDTSRAATVGNGVEPRCYRRLSTSPRNDSCTGRPKLQQVAGPATTCCCFAMVMLLIIAGTAGVEAAAGFGGGAKSNPHRKSSASARRNGGGGDDHDLPFPGAVPPEEIFLQLEREQVKYTLDSTRSSLVCFFQPPAVMCLAPFELTPSFVDATSVLGCHLGGSALVGGSVVIGESCVERPNESCQELRRSSAFSGLRGCAIQSTRVQHRKRGGRSPRGSAI